MVEEPREGSREAPEEPDPPDWSEEPGWRVLLSLVGLEVVPEGGEESWEEDFAVVDPEAVVVVVPDELRGEDPPPPEELTELD